MNHRTRLLALFILLIARPALAQRGLKEIPDPDPELERQSFQVAEGFEVNLFAADPRLAKPIQMNFDARGRLWVVSSEVYPQISPGQVADDKVLILEDEDGDGRSDATTVFADRLLIPTGVEPGDGGAYVANSTDLVHLEDTDGDDRADERRVVLSGFGTEDTHHIIHTFRWGPDGHLYFNQSTYIHSHIETPYGVRRLGGGGIWRFRPGAMRLEVFTRGLINPWGTAFGRWGQVFATDGAGGEGINFMVPGASYAWTPGAERILAGLNPGSPKYCGAEIVSGRHLPEEWQGDIITSDFRGNRVCRFKVSDDGSGFAARELPEVIKTSHVAFRPIDAKMGPDGALYIADWYNPIIQHGEVDFRDPRRDHTHGRIWRVTAKGRPLVERPELAGAPVGALLEALKSPEGWTRHFARRVLQERGPEAVVPALAAWVAGLDGGREEVEARRLEALWTYQALDEVEPGLLASLLEAKDPRVRAAAVRVAGDWHDRLSDPLALLAPRVEDEHPRVRLEAVRALALIPEPRAAVLAMKALDRPTDRFLDYALWLTARDLESAWMPALSAGRLEFDNSKHLAFALQAVGSAAAVGPLLEALSKGGLAAGDRARAVDLIANLGTPDELRRAFALALSGGDPGARAELLAGLAQSFRRRKARPPGEPEGLGRLLDADDAPTRAAAAELAGLWGIEALRPRLRELAVAPETDGAVRRAAVEAMGRLPEGRKALLDLTAPGHPGSARVLAVAALAGQDLPAAAARADVVLADLGPADDPADLLAAFAGRKGGPEALAAALAGRTLPADAAKLGLRAARSVAGPAGESLADAFRRAGGLADGGTTVSAEEKARLVADVAAKGDPARGEAVFRRADLACLKCHAIAGAGGRVGPDLLSVGASAPADYLLDAILEPGKAVKEGYHATVVATSDGRVQAGLKVRETKDELVLRDAEDREVTIPTAEVDEQKPGGSLMPAGLADGLTRAELVDLVRFLSELGKVGGDYRVGPEPVVRRWEILEATRPAEQALRRSRIDEPAEHPESFTWLPAYSRVSGALPLDALPALAGRPGFPRVGFARAELDVTTPGAVRLLVNSTAGLHLWLDGHRIEPAAARDLDLTSGRHRLTVAVDLDARREPLRLELAEVPGSPARAQAVAGK